jgi:hypothetical protein
MPHQVIGDLIGVVVEGGGEIASDAIAQRLGWRGCLISLVIVAVIVGLIIWAVS